MGTRAPSAVAPRTVVAHVLLLLGAATVAGVAIMAMQTHAEKADLHTEAFSSPPAHMTLLALLLAAATALSMGPKTSPLARTAFCCMIIAGTFIPASAANSAGHVNPTAFVRSPVAGRAGRTAPMAPLPLNLALRGGDEAVLHEHSFLMRTGVTFKTKAVKEDGGVRCIFKVDAKPGSVKDVTLHWGVAMKTDDEWVTPQKAGLEGMVPNDSVLYKDRAIRTQLTFGDDKMLETSLFFPDTLEIPMGVRFVLFEPSSDAWYPGGAGGNFFVPTKPQASGKKRPPLTRSPSFTGAVDVETISQQLKETQTWHGGKVEVGDLSHLMWNAAQREAAWVDGKRESTGMRLQRSASFECAVRLLEGEKKAREQEKEQADNFFKNQGGRLYSVPFAYNSDAGRKKGSVKVSVCKDGKVKLEVIPEKGDKGPGKLLLHWGVGNENPGDWIVPDAATLEGLEETSLKGISAETSFKFTSGGEATQELEIQFSKAPLTMNFVLKDSVRGDWYKPGNDNFRIAVSEEGRIRMSESKGSDSGKQGPGGLTVRSMSGTEIVVPDGAEMAKEIMDSESHGSVTLMSRYNTAAHLLEKCPPGPAGRDHLTMIFCWLRFSQIRQLSWQRNYNTKPRELSSASEKLNKLIAWRWKNSEPKEKELYRLMLGCIGRGGSGGDGQAIRDEILHIMHRHKIPESKGHFMEEWHQKLHNNSTPDDIIICQAYLAFLSSNGDRGEFWRVIHENGLNRERLAGYERAITTEPDFYGHAKDGLINDFHNYLRILKNVHAGADLEKCVEVCRPFLDGHMNQLLEAVLRERGADEGRAIGVVDTITEVRQMLSSRMVNEGDGTKLRDLLYLDLGLEAQLRLMAERSLGAMNEGSLGMDKLTRALALWIALAAENLGITASPGSGKIVDDKSVNSEANEMKACVRDWAEMLQEAHKGVSPGWAVRAMAVVERMRRALGETVEDISSTVQPKAEYLGHGLAMVTPEKIPEKWCITLFSEELIRGGGCAFVLSSYLRKLDKALRAQGGGHIWQIVSAGKPGAQGWVEEVPDLMSVQAKTYSRPTILLANSLSGEEEVPPGVVGVITPDAPDVLAHISVRARNLKVFFATCFDADEFENLGRYIGKAIDCEASGDTVVISETDGTKLGQSSEDKLAEGLSGIKISLPPPAKFTKYAIPESDINPDATPRTFGAKSTNIVAARRMLPKWVETPRSAVVPFGVFEKVLEHPENKEIATQYKTAVEQLHTVDEPTGHLRKLQKLILALNAPKELQEGVRAALRLSGIIADGELEGAEWDEAYIALKGVWASKWNDRAWYSCKKAGIGVEYVQMAVLVQRLVESEYAFVIHTENPSNGATDEMYAEVVVGLGETLVGNYPGRALGFSMKKDGKTPPTVESLPSKSVGLFGGGLIFRSDSNGEDLPGFAGAGLYDSIPMVHNSRRTLMYHREPLIKDQALADKIMRGICQVAVDVEAAFGGKPQDIEGCYRGGKFYVVQTRPQV
eukprot:CAMPEP_0180204622 /NCGR_PEP_ID=MMETSP0987-20121128/8521_1 /TAXON_ID=697907 /ORGANISM="non described non described, Strain CCMP2293" /LENGTH=1488 /DNA_ID=CAMNT_0022160147 /DNA_START=98 /DNA_END=4564 /DNA_ORIENTATION=+